MTSKLGIWLLLATVCGAQTLVHGSQIRPSMIDPSWWECSSPRTGTSLRMHQLRDYGSYISRDGTKLHIMSRDRVLRLNAEPTAGAPPFAFSVRFAGVWATPNIAHVTATGECQVGDGNCQRLYFGIGAVYLPPGEFDQGGWATSSGPFSGKPALIVKGENGRYTKIVSTPLPNACHQYCDPEYYRQCSPTSWEMVAAMTGARASVGRDVVMASDPMASGMLIDPKALTVIRP